MYMDLYLVLLGLFVEWQVEAFNRWTMCVFENVDTSLSTCSRLSCSDVLKGDIFQAVLSTEVPVLSECRYDSSSHVHSQDFYPHCTLFASFLSDTHTHKNTHADVLNTHNNQDIVPVFVWSVISYCWALSIQLCELSLQYVELNLAAWCKSSRHRIKRRTVERVVKRAR